LSPGLILIFISLAKVIINTGTVQLTKRKRKVPNSKYIRQTVD